MKDAYFAGGCFWCITPVFREQNGVAEVISGYSGGDEPNPSYEDVKHGKTGHRESICIRYDETIVSYGSLLNIFLWSIDPFDGEGQFIDRGKSYTPAVYYTEPSEKVLAEQRIRVLSSETQKPVPIAVEPFKSFWPAEESHQNYDLKNPLAFAREMVLSGRRREKSPSA